MEIILGVVMFTLIVLVLSGLILAARSKLVNAGDVVHGNFADLLVGMWGGLELHVDPFSNSKKGRLRDPKCLNELAPEVGLEPTTP